MGIPLALALAAALEPKTSTQRQKGMLAGGRRASRLRGLVETGRRHGADDSLVHARPVSPATTLMAPFRVGRAKRELDFQNQ